jgi:hypothetical protein
MIVLKLVAIALIAWTIAKILTLGLRDWLHHYGPLDEGEELAYADQCAGCNRRAYHQSEFIPTDEVCCSACDADPGQHTAACDARVGNGATGNVKGVVHTEPCALPWP